MRITVLYFITITLILFGLGSAVDKLIYDSLKSELEPIINADQEAFTNLLNDISARIENNIMHARLTGAVLLVLLSFVIIKSILQPISITLETQKRFMRNISHEFRTPLTVLKSNSEAALMDPEKLTKEEAIKTIAENLREVDRITNTLKTLQALSNYQNILDNIEFEEINLYPSAQKALKSLLPSAKEKGLELILTGEKILIIHGNAPSIEEMLTNLIKNAITYTPQGKINIDLKKENEHALLSIQDTGIGISPEDLPHIFEPMYRGYAPDIVKDRRGSGLGLAIVREIVRVHRAQIDVKSEPGKGATFYIRFYRNHI